MRPSTLGRQAHAPPPGRKPKREDTGQEKKTSIETNDGAGGEQEPAKKKVDLTGKNQQQTKRARKGQGWEEPQLVATRIVAPKEKPELNTKPTVVEGAEGEPGRSPTSRSPSPRPTRPSRISEHPLVRKIERRSASLEQIISQLRRETARPLRVAVAHIPPTDLDKIQINLDQIQHLLNSRV